MISEPLRHPLSLFDVKGKVALITGASGAFGRGCALALGALGAKLLLVSGSKEELDAVMAETKEIGAEAHALVARPDSLADTQAMLKAARLFEADLHGKYCRVGWYPDDDEINVVVTHGTDCLEETAMLCDLLHDASAPIVFTGAIRPASSPGADGPANLVDAISVAESESANGLGTVIVFGGEIHHARCARKTDTTSLTAFSSPQTGPLGRVTEGHPTIWSRLPRNPTVNPANLDRRVPTPPLYPVDARAFASALFWEEYADTRLVDAVNPVFHERVVRPRVLRQSGDETVVRRHLEEVVPPVFDQLETLFLAPGPLHAGFVAPGAHATAAAPLDIAAIAIWSSIVNLEHVGVRIDAAQWPRLAAFMEASNAVPSLQPIVAEERAALGLRAV